MRINTKQYSVWAGLLLCSVAVASANTLVTFQVDMSNAGIDPSTETVTAHGSFNGWGAGIALTNYLGGATPYLYKGNADIAANGSVIEYKYVGSTAGWENIPKGHNRLATLPATSGASLVLPKVYYADNGSPISVDFTFQVDLAQEINVGAFDPATSIVYPKGTINGWGTWDAMTNNPAILRTNQNGLVTSNVYVNTYTVTGSPGETMDFKFYIDTGNTYESLSSGAVDPSDNNNRFFNLSEGPTQAFPLVFFNDAPYAPVATNNVTFQVDMTAQVLAGSFDPATGIVQVRGDFTSWATTPIICTNDPTAANTNLYTAVGRVVNGLGTTENYKFWSSVSANSGWETMANNRTFTMIKGASQILPPVFFSNVDPANLLPEDTLVTFTVNMTNAVTTDAHVFNPNTDQVFVNADFYGNWNGNIWDTNLPQLTNNPVGSGLYSIQMLVPKGNSVLLNYKFSINGSDNEAPSGTNHVRYVRSAGAYTLPTDKFGNPYVEPYSFGELAASAAMAGQVRVSWLGRPGVYLQTKADLSSGTWQTLLNTDGSGWSNGVMSTNGFVSVTNYPTSAGRTIFRLLNP